MQLIRRFSFTMLLMSMMTLVACGGEGGDLTGGEGGGTPEAVTLTVTKSDGDLSATNMVTVVATVLDNGNPVANKTVTFSLAVEDSAILDPIAGTATTDANGMASIIVKATDIPGSVNVIASYESATEDISFDSVGDGDGDTLSSTTFTITKSAGDLSADNNIIISTSLSSDNNSTPIVGKLVTFTVNDPTVAILDPIVGTAVTDVSGIATIIVKVTDVAGGVEVLATVTDSGSDSESGSSVVSISFTSLGDGVKVVVGEPEAASIRLFASSQQLASSGAQSIELSAIAKDENNNLVEGVTINFASDSGALEKIINDAGDSSNVTGPDGKVKMKLSTQDEPSNRVILVTVTSGDITDSLEIEVVGTTLSLTGSASLALNDETSYIVNVLDSDGNGVAKIDVAISASEADKITLPVPATVKTDSEGQATIKVTGIIGGSNRIIISALGVMANQDVSVQADSFLFTSFSNGVDTVNPSNTPLVPDVSLNQRARVTLTWQRGGVIVPNGTPVSFTTTRGVFMESNGVPVIDAKTETIDGKVTVYLESTDAGKALVTLVGSDVVDGKSIELTNQLDFEFFADIATTIKAQASPNSIGPNEQTSTVSVVVKDVNGNRVKNKKIKFVLEDISGGSIFPATAVTDSSGSASTVYTSNSTSAKDAVSISAIVEDDSNINDSVTLTVSDRELFISLGTGNQLEELGTTDYVKEYSVFVTDAESNAVEGVELTISALPHKYYKGYWFPLYDGDEFVQWVTRGADALEVSVGNLGPLTSSNLASKECDNEDLNFDGILDVGEDFNSDGLLTPGNKVSSQGSVTTDADGRAVIRVIYAQSYAEWLDVKLIASSKVTGSESSAQAIFSLPVLADDVNKEDITPPTAGIGMRGPFGLLNACDKKISQDPKLDGTPHAP
jgi:hypothetical protein